MEAQGDENESLTPLPADLPAHPPISSARDVRRTSSAFSAVATGSLYNYTGVV